MKAKNSARVERRGVGVAMATFESLGFAFREQSESDYGIDAHAELIEAEQPTGQLLGIQIKSGRSYLVQADDSGFVFRTDRRHVEYWRNHSLPVLICLCDIDAGIIYWQIVNAETAISTGEGFKFRIPMSQKVDAESVAAFQALLTPVLSADRYTIFKTDDTSHGQAKRYSFEAVVNGSMTKAEVAAIVRKLTNDGAKRRYHRNHLVEGRWGDADAHVVWTFIFPSAEDYARRNFICRSIWIRDDLEEQFRPMGFDGENVGDRIIVDWNSNYSFIAEHVSSNTLSKEDYFTKILPIVDELKEILALIEKSLDSLARSDITEDEFVACSASHLARVNDIYLEMTDLPFAPFECQDMDVKLNSFIGHLHNIWLHYSERGFATWDEPGRLEGSLHQRTHARLVLQHLEYEMSKVH